MDFGQTKLLVPADNDYIPEAEANKVIANNPQ